MFKKQLDLSQKGKKKKKNKEVFISSNLKICIFHCMCMGVFVCMYFVCILFKMPGPIEFRREYQIRRARITETHLMWTSICVHVYRCECVCMSARVASLITAEPSIPCKHQFNSVFLVLFSVTLVIHHEMM